MVSFSHETPDLVTTDLLLEQVNQQLKNATIDSSHSELLLKMTEALADSRGLVRLSLVEAFGKIGKPAIPFLLEALQQHHNPVVRRSAAKALAQIQQPDTINHLIAAMVRDEDTVVRSSSAGALARIGASALPALLKIVRGNYPNSVKGQASWAMAYVGVEAVKPLHEALKSDDKNVRLAALEAITKIAEEHGDELSQQSIASSLEDEDIEVRLEAIMALSRLPSELALPYLLPLLKKDDIESKKRAILALGKLAKPETLPLLEDLINSQQEGIPLFANIAISQIKNSSEVK
ncbi:MAG: HEAT repeat domain-containing protein [Cyanobacteria bacterium P01_C01_bin.72]